MSRVLVNGIGAVSPAGWGVAALRDAVAGGQPWPTQTVARPGWKEPMLLRRVPSPSPRPDFLAHARLRRSSAIAQYTVAAAMEALGEEAVRVQSGAVRLGIVVCVMAGCVAYSRRFYEETLKDPATASPLLFPETVFNAPASHLAALLSATGPSYTLVGDDSTVLQGLALGADWLLTGQVDGCVIVGAEETDWIEADAMRLFQRDSIHGDGAGALYLKTGNKSEGPPATAELACVTDSFLFTQRQDRATAARRMCAQLPARDRNELLCASAHGHRIHDRAEADAWQDWPGARVAVRKILGEAFSAAAAWQCVLACDALRRDHFAAANVSVVGANLQAIGVRFTPPTD